LIDNEIVSRFGDGPLQGLPDGATLPAPDSDIVFTTDSFVVSPLEFPGGNIGHLAVHGTVNDIAACGGRPRWLSLGLIVEEGLPLDTFRRVLDAIRTAAEECGVTVVTGDTKVVSKGQCDGIYINTAGIGEKLGGFDLSTTRIERGDRVIVSGPVGDHGLAVLAAREGIDIENGPQSDSGPIHRLVAAVSDIAADVHFMRDPTRGGVAAVLNEAVEDTPAGIALDETALPVSTGAHAVTEMLGLDPLHVASEGRLIAICAAGVAETVLERWRAIDEGAGAVAIGTVTDQAGRVVLETLAGGRRLVDVPRGELLPRIC